MMGYLDSVNPTVAGWLFSDENPEVVPVIKIILDGHLIFQCNSDLIRQDVSDVIGNYDRGFSFDINEFTLPGKAHHICVYSDYPHFFDFGSLIIFGISKVEIGCSGWLFLINDSNNNDIKIQSDYSICVDLIERNIDQFIFRNNFFNHKKINNFSILIPERSIVCNDYRINPLNISSSRPAAYFHEKIIDLNIPNFIYPINDFLLNKDHFFHKTDTHLNIAGYLYLFEQISCRHASYSSAFASIPLFQFNSFKGDLAVHAAADFIECISDFDPNSFGDIVFCDPICEPSFRGKLSGSIVKSFNPSAKFGKVYIAGTSSAYYFVRFLSLIFKEVFFEWNNSIDYKKIVDFGPDLFLWFGIERFFPFHDPDKNSNI
jgi:hypothetical protein